MTKEDEYEIRAERYAIWVFNSLRKEGVESFLNDCLSINADYTVDITYGNPTVYIDADSGVLHYHESGFQDITFNLLMDYAQELKNLVFRIIGE